MDHSLGEKLTRNICSIQGENFIKETLSSWMNKTIPEILRDTPYHSTKETIKYLKKFQGKFVDLGPMAQIY